MENKTRYIHWLDPFCCYDTLYPQNHFKEFSISQRCTALMHYFVSTDEVKTVKNPIQDTTILIKQAFFLKKNKQRINSCVQKASNTLTLISHQGFFTYAQKCQLWHCRLYYMKTKRQNVTPSGNRSQELRFQIQHAPS